MINQVLDLMFKLSLMDRDIFLKYYSIIKSQELDPLSKRLIIKVNNYLTKYNRIPCFDFFVDFVQDLERSSKTPFNYYIKRYDEPLDYYYDKFINSCKKYYKQIISELVLKEESEDVEIILQKYQKLIKDLEFEVNDIFVKKDIDKFIDEFKSIRDGDNEVLIPTGFGLIDNFSGGIQRSDYVLFVSRPQSFKTWIMCQLAVNFSRNIEGGKILFFSKEMSKVQILKRIISIAGNINYELIKRHKLNDNRLIELKKKLLDSLDSEIIIIGKEQDVDYDPVYVKNKILEYNPDVVIIDGLYLFAKSDEWENHSRISRVFRDISLSLNVPIIGTLQFSRRGLGRGNVAYSDSYEQDASLFIGMERVEDSNKNYTNEVNMRVLKVRDGKVDIKSKIIADFDNMVFKEMVLTDTNESFEVKKVKSISSELKSSQLELLKNSLKTCLSDRLIYDIHDDKIKKIIERDLGREVIFVNKDEGLPGLLSKSKDDRFYYIQIDEYLFRIYCSSKMYVSIIKYEPLFEVKRDTLDFSFNVNSFSESMIQNFIKKISTYVLRGRNELRNIIKNIHRTYIEGDLISGFSIELMENYLKHIFEFKDPLANLLLLLRNKLFFIKETDQLNDYVKSCFNSGESEVLRYFVLSIFYDYVEQEGVFRLKDEYKQYVFDLCGEKAVNELISSLENIEHFRKFVVRR
jgi:replicative DNA helicase